MEVLRAKTKTQNWILERENDAYIKLESWHQLQ